MTAARKLGLESLESRVLLSADFRWATTPILSSSEGRAVAADPASGAVYMTGGDYAHGSAVIAKYQSDGSLAWQHSLGSAGNEGLSIAVDTDGGVLVAGLFSGTVDVDPGAGVNNLTSAGSIDAFALKLTSGGSLVWARQFGGGSSDWANSIVPTGDGGAWVGGNFAATSNFGLRSLTSQGGSDVFIARLNSAGETIWVGSFGNPESLELHSLALGTDGLYACGGFKGTVDFDPGSLEAKSTSSGGFDAFVTKLDTSGNFLWTKTFGAGGDDYVADVSVTSEGVYLTGAFTGTVDFDPGTKALSFTSASVALSSGSIATNGAFVTKLDTAGNFRWARQYTGIGAGQNIVAVAGDGVYVNGVFKGTVDFDPSAGVYNLTSKKEVDDSSYSTDVFLSKLDTDGNPFWAGAVGGEWSESGYGMAVGSQGMVYMTGFFGYVADFDPGADVHELTVSGSNQGQADCAFLVALQPAWPLTLSVGDLSIPEGASGKTTRTLTVQLSSAVLKPIAVNYTTTAGTATDRKDFTSVNGTLTFAPGQTAKTITVTVMGDKLHEDNETFTVNLVNPSTGVGLAKAAATVTIVDDDPIAPTSISDVKISEGKAGKTAMAKFTVTLAAASGAVATVNYTTVDGTATAANSDYVPTSGTLTFLPGEKKKTILVPIVGDATYEAEEKFSVVLSGAAGCTIVKGTGTGTIKNDDAAPYVSITDVQLSESGGPAVFTISLAVPSALGATVNYATAASSAKAVTDFIAKTGSVSFAPGETTKTISVDLVDDAVLEKTETFSVKLSGAVGCKVKKSSGKVTVLDDDAIVLPVASSFASMSATSIQEKNAAVDETIRLLMRL